MRSIRFLASVVWISLAGCGSRSDLAALTSTPDGPGHAVPDAADTSTDATIFDEAITDATDEATALRCVVEVAAGTTHTCARTADGSMWCWGTNYLGELGDGTRISTSSPVRVAFLGNDVAGIAVGQAHTCALKTDGTLRCWGYNVDGELGVGTTTDATSPLQVTTLGNSVSKVAAGYSHTCATDRDGSLWCWGGNAEGEVGDGTMKTRSQPVQVTPPGMRVISFALGAWHTCIVDFTGSTWCWGDNTSGELGIAMTGVPGLTPTRVSGLPAEMLEIAAGAGHTCAIAKDGTLWCWGRNRYGELGDGTMSDRTLPVRVKAFGSTVAAVTARYYHTCAIATERSLWCWGWGGSGQLGNGALGSSSNPVQVPLFGEKVTQAAAGESYTCARTEDGALWCWGGNGPGVLGDGTGTDMLAPTRVFAPCP